MSAPAPEGVLYVRATVLIKVTVRGTPNPEGIAKMKANMRASLERTGATVESLELASGPRRAPKDDCSYCRVGMHQMCAKDRNSNQCCCYDTGPGAAGGTSQKLDELSSGLEKLAKDRRKIAP